MPEINLSPDKLNSVVRQFHQTPLKKSVFVNSIPKSGSHMLRNILRMFIPVEQLYKEEFIQWPNLAQHAGAFSPNQKLLISGHLLYSDKSAMLANRSRKILLVRDPYSWVLAQARFFVSDVFSSNFDHIRNGGLTVDDLISLMIFGIYQKSPPMRQQYELYAMGWMGTDIHLVRYEDLTHHVGAIDTEASEHYFSALLSVCGIDRPNDWKARVLAGSNRAESPTARENINTKPNPFTFPDTLSKQHQKLIDVSMPGVRELLGYR